MENNYRDLTKPNNSKVNSVISFNGTPIRDDKRYLMLFNKQLTDLEHPVTIDKSMRKTLSKFSNANNDVKTKFRHVKRAISRMKASKEWGSEIIHTAPIML